MMRGRAKLPPPRAPRRPTRGRTLAAAAGLAALALALGTLLVLIVAVIAAAAGVRVGPVGAVVLATLVTQGVAFVGVSWFYFRLRGLPLACGELAMPRGADLRWVFRAWALSLAWVILAGWAAAAVGLEPAPHQLETLAREAPMILPVLAVLSVLVIGPGEELLFRGTVQRHLARAWSDTTAIILAGLLFAVVHVVALEGVIETRAVTIAILVGPSLLFGLAYARTRNVVVPALAHGAYDATLLGVLYAGMS